MGSFVLWSWKDYYYTSFAKKNKTMFTKHKENIAQFSIYLVIGNLSYKIWRLRVRLREIIVYFIFIYKNNLFSIKIRIYHQIIRIIIKDIQNYRQINITNKVIFFCLRLKTLNWLDIITLKTSAIKNLLIIYADRSI